MKLINLLSDKIDYLFRRGKDADQRTYDFFIRTVTFLILALIILCYGSFVHADGNVYGGTVGTGNIVEVTTLSNAIDEYINTYGSDAYNPLLGTSLYYTYPNRPYMSEEFLLNYAFPTSVSGRVFEGAHNAWVNVQADSTSHYILIVPCNRSFYIEGSGTYDFTTNDTNCSYEIFFIDKSTQFIEQRGVNGCYIRNFDNTKTYTSCPTVAVKYDTTTGTYTYGVVDSSKSGNGIDLGAIVYTNAPVFSKGSNITSSQFSNTEYSSIINSQSGNDFFVQSNPLILDGTINPDGSINVDPTEGTENNLSVDKFEIALSGSKSNIGINQANLVIGVSTSNDFILNNIDKYDMEITCSFGVTGSDIPSFIGSKQYTYPLTTFTNDVFEYSILELARDIKVNNQSFFDYYMDVLGTHEVVIQNNPLKNYNGAIPTLINKMYEVYIGSYHVESTSNINLIQNAYLTVSIQLKDKSGNSSLEGTKVFNFKDGTESITSAGILQNQNPWEGDPTYTESPFPQSTGSGGSAGGNSQINNNNQTVNINLDNRFQNIVSGGATDDDYNNTVDNLRELFGTFKQSLAVMGDSTLDQNNNPNGFVGLLQSSYNFIPGMSYYILGIVIIVALCVLLFIIKALVF